VEDAKGRGDVAEDYIYEVNSEERPAWHRRFDGRFEVLDIPQLSILGMGV